MSAPVATLLPLTSVKGFTGAVSFMSWLAKTGQQGWQMLPISGPITTPYRNQGVGIASYFFDPRVPQPYQTWLLSYSDFLTANQDWLLDFALFQALCEKYQQINWWEWPHEIATFQDHAVASARQQLSARIEVFLQEQYFLTNQFLHLKKIASDQQLMLIGDLPFYLARESSLVWSHQDLFMLPERGELILQSGVPASPDEPFTAQYWGHPLYNWGSANPEAIVNLFNLRLRFLSQFFNLIRLDHANGFFRYGMMSLRNPNWSQKVAGPGAGAIEPLLAQAQRLNYGLYFEDTASEKMMLEQYMKRNHIAGVDILALLYNLENTQGDKHQPALSKLKFPRRSPNKVLFTSTHDTPPLITWVKSLPPPIKNSFLTVNSLPLDLPPKRLAKHLRDWVVSSDAKLVVVPWQDWQLDDFRFNVPGQEELTNWNYIINAEDYL